MSNPIELFKAGLESKVGSFKAVLGTDIATTHFIQSLVTMVGRNSEWLDETKVFRPSLYQAAMDAAEVNLPLAQNLRQVYFVPRWNKKTGKKHVAMEISYHGLLKLAFRSGKIASFQSECVFEGDEFSFELGTNAHLKHVPAMPRGTKLLCVWGMATFYGPAQPAFVVVPKDDIDRTRSLSKSDFWDKWFVEMCRKTALRRLAKFLDMCPELQKAVAIEERNEGEYERVLNPKPVGAAEALKAKLLPKPVEVEEEQPQAVPIDGEDLSFDGPIPEE